MMRNMQFTVEQQQAIDAREREILVAAAAGSGKTAVLVERIVMLMLRERIPITQLVVLTFTNAAAAQMKERIRQRLQELIAEGHTAEQQFLTQQILLLPAAHIRTFHAYCIDILRNYYQFVDLSPQFKIIEENQLVLLKEEALAQTLEMILQEKTQYQILLDYFVVGNSLDRLEATLRDIYEKTRSYAFIDQWMQRALDFTEDEQTIEGLIDEYIVRYYEKISEWQERLHVLEHDVADFPKNQQMLFQLQDMLQQLTTLAYDTSLEALRILEFPKWPAIKKDVATSESKRAHETFKKLKEEIKGLSERSLHAQEIREEQHALTPVLRQLLNGVTLYEKNLHALKRAKDLLDFSDVEHEMIALLTENEAVRKTLAKNIHEILVDEYQDTNEVQNTILQLLQNTTNRLFMVGDIKQAIYRFRQADPKIFLTKKEQYAHAPVATAQKLIVLNKNFRSSETILSTVNTIFTSLFKLDIAYPEAERLFLGNTAYQNENDYYTKWHFFTEQDEAEAIEIVQPLAEKKATVIVNEIIRLLQEEKLFDEKTKTSRPVRLHDIAVLFRSRGSQLITYVKQKLDQAGIHYTSESDKGYFEAVEVNVILSLLNVLENPYHTIAFLAYLRSPICHVSDEELLLIADYYRTSSTVPTDKFYTYVTYYIKHQQNELATRLQHILAQLTDFRHKLTVMKLSQALEMMYQETYYYHFVAGLPKGNTRTANLDMLVRLARQQEEKGKNNLYSFNKYMRNLQKNKRDFAIAKHHDELTDTLQFMTIHTSKGLEFPIVFFIDMDKKFNERETRENYQMSKTHGLALQYHDLTRHIRYKTQHYQMLADQAAFEAKAEELRVLYVALTRPMHHLHLFLDESEKIQDIETTSDILRLDSYGSALRAVYDRTGGQFSHWQTERISLAPFIEHRQLQRTDEQAVRLRQEKTNVTQEEIATLTKRMQARYLYHDLEHYQQKYTVSELKNRFVLRETQPQELIQRQEQKDVFVSRTLYQEVPQFMQAEATLSPLEKGTLYHLVLQYYPWEQMPEVEVYISELVAQGVISERDSVELVPQKIAQTVQELHTDYLLQDYTIVAQELPFSFAYPAKAVYDEALFADETVLIQGKIDLLLQKDDTFVIIDFKTDTLKAKETIATLEKRYEQQLFFYRLAVQKFYQTAETKIKTKIYPILA